MVACCCLILVITSYMIYVYIHIYIYKYVVAKHVFLLMPIPIILISCFPFRLLAPSAHPTDLHKEWALKNGTLSQVPLMCFQKLVHNKHLSIHSFPNVQQKIHSQQSRVNGVWSGLAHGPALSAALDHEVGDEAFDRWGMGMVLSPPVRYRQMPWKTNSCCQHPHGCFQKLGVPQNGWFIMENPIKMDDLGVPSLPHIQKLLDIFPSVHSEPGFFRHSSVSNWPLAARSLEGDRTKGHLNIAALHFRAWCGMEWGKHKQ